MQKPEFKIGQHVTFKPYEKECKCVVKDIITNATYLDGSPDDRVFYKLSGEAISTTTGSSIMQSEHFGEREYTINFNGRKNGALGITYPITDYRTAKTRDKAILALYDDYEHISNVRLSIN